MKKNIIINFFIGLLCTYTFAQKTIENPECRFSSIPGIITKIELLDTTTVLHFRLKRNQGSVSRISVPKSTYIKDTNGEDKLFITKAEGIKLNTWHPIPESGEVIYSLYFPKLNPKVKSIDFGEDKDRWTIYDIILNEEDLPIPKVLMGNWMLTDGSNQWDYGFYLKNAVVDGTVWKYKSVEVKGKKYIISLEKAGQLKTIYAKLGKNGLVNFAKSPKQYKVYSTKKVHNPNFKPINNDWYTEEDIKHGFTTYSGLIKGYTSSGKEKTGTVSVNNIFTGSQESYIVKIAEDGSFSVKIPVPCPTGIIVVLPSNIYSFVFVEPGKEIFHLIDGGNSKFMGDGAQVNSDLSSMQSIQYEFVRGIGEKSPEDYKKLCFDNGEKYSKKIDSINKGRFICNKALQLKKLEVELIPLIRIADYETRRWGFGKRNELIKDEKRKMLIKEFKVDASYYNYIPEDVLNNKMAVLSGFYDMLISGLKYSKVFRESDTKVFSVMLQTAEARQDNMAEFLKVPECFMLDVISCQGKTRNLLEFNPYSDTELKNIKETIKTPFLSNYLTFLNDKTKAEVEEKKTDGYTEYTDKTEDDEQFRAIFEKFKDKVVYVGFWRTYCGPCLTGMDRIKPLKEAMKNEDVVFLYIADQKSDEKVWKNLIADIDGEHLRVSTDEWNYLAAKFNISLFPHYALINKKGEIVNPRMKINHSNDELKAIFKTEIEK
ncbi:TlpA family protein disulfide reductase [Flavivirga jejuensis]|uniref:TlpA disulfide reductase family protein n=1 Tax=Flavivirga jejuensis TaxID=870487 RepID=A0ABT8WMF9_9FLAO|nr:TlpA disulfide reductase family protein [Flavivirga jejuensis]MDO5974340.1 TlpA disulfide reductase family protein [Flavivirga jejuensis]